MTVAQQYRITPLRSGSSYQAHYRQTALAARTKAESLVEYWRTVSTRMVPTTVLVERRLDGGGAWVPWASYRTDSATWAVYDNTAADREAQAALRQAQEHLQALEADRAVFAPLVPFEGRSVVPGPAGDQPEGDHR